MSAFRIRKEKPTMYHDSALDGRGLKRVDREAVEKSFLKSRIENFTRYKASEVDRPFEVIPYSNALYATREEQLKRDFAKTHQAEARIEREKRTAMLDRKRARRAEQDAARVEQETALYNKDQDTMAKHRINETKNRKNLCGLSYNIVSMEYSKTRAGEALKRKDTLTKERAIARSEALSRRRNGEFNPITGERYVPRVR